MYCYSERMFAMDCGRALTPPPSFVRNRQDVASAPLSYELHALYTIQHNPLECLVSLPQELPLQTQPLQIHHHTYHRQTTNGQQQKLSSTRSGASSKPRYHDQSNKAGSLCMRHYKPTKVTSTIACFRLVSEASDPYLKEARLMT